jgi:hypothetical protein
MIVKESSPMSESTLNLGDTTVGDPAIVGPQDAHLRKVRGNQLQFATRSPKSDDQSRRSDDGSTLPLASSKN